MVSEIVIQDVPLRRPTKQLTKKTRDTLNKNTLYGRGVKF
ncbi:hypothetical protein T12_16139 [Trichinella patagoniensis]|uniref:Uncharacterized protein n=1 Tax=Trichinella patagoniensis TaxID=990121 RepID=A0A0V0YQR3_9BILA|nr:hypothetical protein T12_3852 [Trichinella patagoniensis]KRY02606.1 hypothetical protein T12_3162 [Trichinella patagoniensis]KRY03366.1 hypothetical protein T12_16139 [Trichinella patagoniensis]